MQLRNIQSNRSIRSKIVAVVALAMISSLADTAAIGVATSSGHFKVDNNKVLRNATLFDGTLVETGAISGEMRLRAANVAFDANTRAKVFKDHVVLDSGKIEWTGGPSFRAEAGFVSVTGESDRAKAVVLRNANTIQVASLTGSVRVLSETGALISTVAAGTAVELSQDGAQGGSTTTDPTTTTEDGPSRKKIVAVVIAGIAGVTTTVAVVKSVSP